MRKATAEGLVCAECRSESVIQIEMKLPDGTEAIFNSCHVCEARWWNRGGESVAVDGIIDLVSE